MMKSLKYYLIVIGAVLTLLLSTIGVSADSESDTVDDVYHYAWSETRFTWQVSVTDKPNIDITELSYSVEGTKLVLSLTVDGTIQSSENIVYWVFYNSSDSTYYMTWSDGTGTGIAMSLDTTIGSFDYGEVTAEGGTLSAEFDLIGGTDESELWGWAAEYSSEEASQEWWGDWAPASYAPFDEGDITGNENEDETGDGSEDDQDTSGDDNSNTGTTGTPGFEVITVVMGVLFVIYLIRRRK